MYIKRLGGSRWAPGGCRTISAVPFIYVLRTYPELSETFILREIEAVAASGRAVQVLAAGPGRRPDLAASAWQTGSTPCHYLAGSARSRPVAARETRARRRPLVLIRQLAGDLLSLRGHPRRSARAMRLALYAWRGSRLIPAGGCRLHAHFANDAAVLARYLAAVSGGRYTLTAHAYDLYSDPFLLSANLAAADRVFTVSRANLEFLRRCYGRGSRSGEQLRLLHCGLDLPRLPWRAPAAVASPAHLVCVARLVAKKGHLVLLEAVARLRGGGHAVRLTLIGEGPEEVSVRAAIQRLGLTDVVSLRGALDNAATLDVLRQADLCVLAARVAGDGDRDGLPVVLMEAAAVGLPVAATSVGGIPELVREDTGWLAPPDDPEALAGVLVEALSSPPEERFRRSRQARDVIEREFDVQGQVSALTAADLDPAAAD